MSSAPAATPAPRDHVRETFETLVFVVVLVLILQLFVLEAFVIPTGSMAETELGYHKNVVCQQCKYPFPVNGTDRDGNPDPNGVTTYLCPNCQHLGRIPDSVGITSGDRVLVHKSMGPDDRGRVVVFKFPVTPQRKMQAQNYIKRCVGFGEETIALAHGDLYVTKALKYKNGVRPPEGRECDLWQNTYTYHRDDAALALFKDSKANGFPTGVNGFELYRKPDELALEMRRIVNDNDFLPADVTTRRWKARDGDGAGWAEFDPAAPKSFRHAGGALGWVGYRHLSELRNGRADPQPIRNAMAYNYTKGGSGEDYWVGDLMLECTAKTEAGSEITLELSKGEHRYQATFADGKVTLVRTGPGNWAPVSRPTPMSKPGTYQLRFANVDCRLRVWVNDVAIDFGGEADYPPSAAGDKPVAANDIEAPVSIGAKGDVTVSGLRVWRDTYYTPSAGADTVDTYYVQPGHYLCLGDNSAQSSDGRTWGVVPERLMIGRAVFTFFPISRIGVIR